MTYMSSTRSIRDYFIERPLTPHMRRLIRRVVDEGLSGYEIWEATHHLGPSGYMVVEGLCRRHMLDWYPGNAGTVMRATDKARAWVAENP